MKPMRKKAEFGDPCENPRKGADSKQKRRARNENQTNRIYQEEEDP
jgi:hypothetical protein